MRGSEIQKRGKNLFCRLMKALLCAYSMTGILLLGLAFFLYKLKPDERLVPAGITVIYAAAAFTGGVVIGRITESRRFLWGAVLGMLYFGILVILNTLICRTVDGMGAPYLSVFLLCAGGGMAGGMIS